MKKSYRSNFQIALIGFVLLCSLLLLPSSVTASSSTTIQLWIGNPSMTVNGVQQRIDSQGTKPVVSSGRTLLPIRSVIEAFGGTVAWESSTSKITLKLGNNSLELWIGKPQASLNGTTKSIDAANSAVVPVTINGRTMLPIRFVAESLGIDVQYDNVTSMITLKEPEPSQLTVYCNLLLGYIYVDGERTASVQGSYGRTIKGLLPGTHTVKITESGYADWSKQVSIEAGKTTTLYAYLALGADNGAPSRSEVITPDSAASYGSLTVYSNMLNSNIYVGGEPGGTAMGSQGRTIKGLLPGTYTLKITESGYADWSKQVSIEAGKTTTLYAYLALGADNGAPSRSEVITPDSAASYGSLKVYSNMLNSNIYVGGEPGGTTQGSTGRTIKGLLPGTYTLKITESGYKDWTGQVTITAGQTVTIDAKLVRE